MRKRKLSRFLAREMLFDFISNRLDPVRRKAIVDTLDREPSLKDDLDILQTGYKYVESLESLRISNKLLEEVKPKSLLPIVNKEKAKLFFKVTGWTAAVGFALGFLIVSTPKLANIISVSNSKKVVAEIKRKTNLGEMEVSIPKASEQEVLDSINVINSEEIGEEIDEKVETENKPENNQNASQTESIHKLKIEEEDEVEKIEQEPVKAVNSETEKEKAAVIDKGEVFRVVMFSDNVTEITPKIADQIIAFGGEKAGSVRLGWRKRNGSYFHFSLPEENYDKLIDYLGGFSTFTATRSRHQRVMPNGIRRVILWIEDTEK